MGSGQAALQARVAGQSRQEAAPAPHASPAPACVQELQDPWGLFQLLCSFTSSLLSLVQALGRPPGLPLEQESAQVRGGLREAGSSPQVPSSVLPALSSRRLLPCPGFCSCTAPATPGLPGRLPGVVSGPHGLGSYCGWSRWGLLWSFHGVNGLKSLAFGGSLTPRPHRASGGGSLGVGQR